MKKTVLFLSLFILSFSEAKIFSEDGDALDGDALLEDLFGENITDKSTYGEATERLETLSLALARCEMSAESKAVLSVLSGTMLLTGTAILAMDYFKLRAFKRLSKPLRKKFKYAAWLMSGIGAFVLSITYRAHSYRLGFFEALPFCMSKSLKVNIEEYRRVKYLIDKVNSNITLLNFNLENVEYKILNMPISDLLDIEKLKDGLTDKGTDERQEKDMDEEEVDSRVDAGYVKMIIRHRYLYLPIGRFPNLNGKLILKKLMDNGVVIPVAGRESDAFRERVLDVYGELNHDDAVQRVKDLLGKRYSEEHFGKFIEFLKKQTFEVVDLSRMKHILPFEMFYVMSTNFSNFCKVICELQDDFEKSLEDEFIKLRSKILGDERVICDFSDFLRMSCSDFTSNLYRLKSRAMRKREQRRQVEDKHQVEGDPQVEDKHQVKGEPQVEDKHQVKGVIEDNQETILERSKQFWMLTEMREKSLRSYISRKRELSNLQGVWRVLLSGDAKEYREFLEDPNFGKFRKRDLICELGQIAIQPIVKDASQQNIQEYRIVEYLIEQTFKLKKKTSVFGRMLRFGKSKKVTLTFAKCLKTLDDEKFAEVVRPKIEEFLKKK
ncbi:hypothetical protein ACFLY6_01585 [Candidatus Dependentiae bacterium]